jgi:hypothetical protein
MLSGWFKPERQPANYREWILKGSSSARVPETHGAGRRPSLAEAEDLPGHGAAVRVRLESSDE